MDINTRTFCDMIRTRSRENLAALRCFGESPDVPSPVLSVLRHELNSLILVIYLLSVKDIKARRRLIDSTLRGSQWNVRGANGRLRSVTDRDFTGLSEKLKGWTKSMYKFGCGLIHLSEFHDRFAVNPFDKLKPTERLDILSHLRSYHDGPVPANPDIPELSRHMPRVFEEISGNLERYLIKLEQDESLDEYNARPGAAAETTPPPR